MTPDVKVVNDSIKKPQPDTLHCDKCNIEIPKDIYPRHMQIHNVAARFTSNELLASLVLTTTEIKVKLDELLQLKAYEMASKRSR